MNKFCTNNPIIKSDVLNTKINLQVILSICFVLIKIYMTNIFTITFPTIKLMSTMVSAAESFELRRKKSIPIRKQVIEVSFILS